jgi:predicted lipoprotein with Yx(FWY)xxD motif
MFYKVLAFIALLGATTLAACGGGAGGSGGAGVYGGPPATTPPTQPANMPQQQTVGGGPAFVNPGNNFTLYFLDVDTQTGSACTGGCLSEWHVLKPSNGATAQGDFSIVTRSDGTGKQWAYQKHPLYTFAGDSGPDQEHGNGLPLGGGHWHVARPVHN